MPSVSLKHDICSVDCGARKTYGGSQMFSEDKTIRKCGCGIAAAAELLFYIGKYHSPMNNALLREMTAGDTVCIDTYRRFLTQLSHYLPLIPGRGINGIMLVGGINVFLRRYGAKVTALWCFSGEKMWDRCADMLSRDYPVIFSVGTNFPKFWGKERLRLYSPAPDGSYHPSGSTRAHLMTMTGMDEEWICVSSWGHKYFISKAEYEAYVHEHSGSVVCNIVYVKAIPHNAARADAERK